MSAKKGLLYLMLLVICICPIKGYTMNYQESNHIVIEKFVTNDNGVFLLINDQWLGVEAIEATSDGIMIMEEGVWMSLLDVVESYDYWTWTCPECGYTNVQGVRRCRNCNYQG